jgi:hypothetical protein
MKPIRTIVGVLLIALVGVLLGKNLIAKAAVIGGAKAMTGLNVQVRDLDVGFPRTAVRIQGLRVMNPSGFPDPLMLEMPEIFVDYDLGAFVKGKAHLETVRLNLKELNVIRSADGKLNLDSIRAIQSGQAPGKAQRSAPPGRAPEFAIDVLELKVGKVVFKDYTKGPAAQVMVYDVRIDERYEHITNPYTFAGLVISRALFKTTVGRLTGFDVAGLQAGVANALKASAGQLGSVVGSAEQVGRDAFGTAEQVGRDATGAAKDAVDAATGTIKKIFGN